MRMANGNRGEAFSKISQAEFQSPTRDTTARSLSRVRSRSFSSLRPAFCRAPFAGHKAALLKALKRAAENRRRMASSISQWRPLHMTKEQQKALAIIIASLGVLVILLFWANHLRPHP